jgi:ribonuclease R
VERVLGRREQPGVDVLAVIYGHELPIDFPPDAVAEADALAAKGITAEDRAGREDRTDTLVFTIDPADAKDHDDALSIRRLDEGLWEVGVHIADVSHYVREGTALDAEALARGTSVYLVDRVVPMLPHALSSDLCSLRPDEDRLTLSLILTLTDAGEVRDQRLVRAVIRSRHKLSYDMAQAVLDRSLAIDDETDEALRSLAAIARSLRATRSRRGSIDFDLPEARVVLDSAGAPTDIQRVQRFESHRLIEDFMLLANETIAARAAKAKVPFIYRVHEAPDEAKIEALAAFAATFGYRLKTRGEIAPADLQRVLDQARGRPEEGLLSMIVLRSMKQARYSTENLGHFGLAARSYTHFTSPIRRYPDLMIHRISGAQFIDGERADRARAEALDAVAKLSSERERVAVSAERESVDLKKAEFMERHIGDDFEGTISSVTSFGFFVLLDAFFVEGLVHVSSLEDDYYMYVEDQYMLVGEHTRRQFRLGDRFRVQVARVDREENRIDFLLRAEPGREGRRGSRRRTRKRT